MVLSAPKATRSMDGAIRACLAATACPQCIHQQIAHYDALEGGWRRIEGL